MINLIPKEEKRRMIRDFYVRFSAVFLVAISCVLVVATVALMPSYFIIGVRQKVAENDLQLIQKKVLSEREIETVTAVNLLNDKLKLINNARQDKFLVTRDVINAILIRKTPEIKINQIEFLTNEADGKKIRINGSASSREKLLAFRIALENNPSFSKVDLPISNFVRGSNIPFFMSMIVN